MPLVMKWIPKRGLLTLIRQGYFHRAAYHQLVLEAGKRDGRVSWAAFLSLRGSYEEKQIRHQLQKYHSHYTVELTWLYRRTPLGVDAVRKDGRQAVHVTFASARVKMGSTYFVML